MPIEGSRIQRDRLIALGVLRQGWHLGVEAEVAFVSLALRDGRHKGRLEGGVEVACVERSGACAKPATTGVGYLGEHKDSRRARARCAHCWETGRRRWLFAALVCAIAAAPQAGTTAAPAGEPSDVIWASRYERSPGNEEREAELELHVGDRMISQ
jgi:hypothetical protein